MSANQGAAIPATEATNPWLIAIVVALAAFMEVLDTTIANVALNYIAGGLGVSEDEASWVVTTYLVANAIIVTATGFLANRFGRKTFFLACLGLFTVSSVLCGIAWNLQALLVFRLLQGFGGGGIGLPMAVGAERQNAAGDQQHGDQDPFRRRRRRRSFRRVVSAMGVARRGLIGLFR